MNIMTLNIRGVGDSHKVRWIKELKLENNIDMIFLQETRMSNPVTFGFHLMWDKTPMDYELVESTGLSGGIWCIWNKDIFMKSSVVKDRNFLLVSGTMKDRTEAVHFMNVYAPQGSVEKRRLWEKILILRTSLQGIWFIAGDFNEVRNADERRKSRFNGASSRYFNEFIFNANLFEYALVSGRFTFRVGNKLSKIDHILVSEEVWNAWPHATYRTLNSKLSDHRPLVLIVDKKDFGKIPFKCYNSWLKKTGFDDLIKEANEAMVEVHPPDRNLALKLKKFKEVIKSWRSKQKQKEGEELNNCNVSLQKLEELAESRDLSPDEEQEFIEKKAKLLQILDDEQQDMRQKARARWAIEGDENTNFYHRFINSRVARSRLNGLIIDDVWCSDPNKIKLHVYNFFSDKFMEPTTSRPMFTCHGIRRLSNEDNERLVSPFSLEEIRAAVWDCNGDRAPGPDGFNFNFIKHFWGLLEADFFRLMTHFHTFGSISQGVTSSFIALIPKVNDPTTLNDYRPINLIGCISKTLSKILAARIKLVIGSLISEEQSAFMKDRNILDGPLILNEITSWLKKSKTKAFILKLDFAKAFDSISWVFIDRVLEQMNFNGTWRSWIMEIFRSSRASVLINGSPTEEFTYSRGVRQGDPLSPFIFILAMEALSCFINRVKEYDMIGGIKLPHNGPTISHLIFADDVILLGAWSTNNIRNLSRLLRCFDLVSGLHLNPQKTTIFGLGTLASETNDMANFINCQAGVLPFIYLGIKVTAKMSRCANWDEVLSVFSKRLARWKALSLSIGGRITILKSVMDSLPVYYFSLYPAPVKVIKKLEAIRRCFFWGGVSDKKHMDWVKWKHVCAPISAGGLGLGSLIDINNALLAKWAWRFKVEQNRLWRKVIASIHHKPRTGTFLPYKQGLCGAWCRIVRSDLLKESPTLDVKGRISAIVGDGRSVSFWLDSWNIVGPLQRRFPLLFKREKQKHCMVKDRMAYQHGEIVFSWNWTASSLSQMEQTELEDLVSLLSAHNLSNEPDRWQWDGGTEPFSVKAIKKLMSQGSQSYGHQWEWNRWLPKKVNIFGWRAALNRLPTRVALQRRNINVISNVCPHCEECEETLDHILLHCQTACIVWEGIARWMNIPLIYAFDTVDLLSLHKIITGSEGKKKIFKSVILVACWYLWFARNERIFRGKVISPTTMVLQIKKQSFLWISSRQKALQFSMDQWHAFDIR